MSKAASEWFYYYVDLNYKIIHSDSNKIIHSDANFPSSVIEG